MQITDNQETPHPSSDVSRSTSTQDLLLIMPPVPDSLRSATGISCGTAPVTAGGEAEENPGTNSLTIVPRWTLFFLDWHAYAIDPYADHPLGLWIARRGHRLSGGTQPSQGQGPGSDPCE
jgi:hypothetical protein